MAEINWYPGHMAKAVRQMENDIRSVDAVIELLDARIPRSSRNPEIARLTGEKPRLVVLNREDQADPEATRLWKEAFRREGAGVLVTDCQSGRGVGAIPGAVRTLLEEKLRAYREKGQVGRTLRAMILGIPNVGKSSLINRMAGRKAAEAANRPGVTRGRQWIRVTGDFELLDTPGILWPKLGEAEIGENLALTGAIRDEITDTGTLALALIRRLSHRYPQALSQRYGAEIREEETPLELLEAVALRRGCRVRGGEPDYDRAAAMLVEDFRSGRLGRLTLEVPEP